VVNENYSATATKLPIGHVIRRHGIENLVVTGKVDGRRGSGRRRLKYLDSLRTCLRDKVCAVD